MDNILRLLRFLVFQPPDIWKVKKLRRSWFSVWRMLRLHPIQSSVANVVPLPGPHSFLFGQFEITCVCELFSFVTRIMHLVQKYIVTTCRNRWRRSKLTVKPICMRLALSVIPQSSSWQSEPQDWLILVRPDPCGFSTGKLLGDSVKAHRQTSL